MFINRVNQAYKTEAHTCRQFNTITKKDLDQNSGWNLYTSKLLPSVYFPFYSIVEKGGKTSCGQAGPAWFFLKLTFPSANFPDVNWIGEPMLFWQVWFLIVCLNLCCVCSSFRSSEIYRGQPLLKSPRGA